MYKCKSKTFTLTHPFTLTILVWTGVVQAFGFVYSTQFWLFEEIQSRNHWIGYLENKKSEVRKPPGISKTQTIIIYPVVFLKEPIKECRYFILCVFFIIFIFSRMAVNISQIWLL